MKFTKTHLKALLGAASTLSIMFTGLPVHAAPTEQQSPLLSQSQGAQTSVANVVEAIKNAAGGSVNATTVGNAIAEALAANPGITQETLAGAINQMGLTGDALSAALSASANAMGVSMESMASAMITNAYMNGGKAGATQQIEALRNAVGSDIVNGALENVPTEMLASAGDLSNIEPAAGVYEG
jgi:type II secretory pathway component PulM